MQPIFVTTRSLTPWHDRAGHIMPPPLQKAGCYLFTILSVLVFCIFSVTTGIAAAEEQNTFVQSEPQCFSYDEESYLAHVFYLSDQEIWFDFPQAGTKGELVCFDLYGTMVDTIPYERLCMQGDDVNIECLQRVGDRLMLGYRDFATNFVEVIILSDTYEELARTPITDAINGMFAPLRFDPMVPCQQGILFAGIIEEKEGNGYTSQLYLTLIDDHGRRVFESREAKQSDSEQYGIHSIICSGGDYHYILSQNRASRTVPKQERLICKNGQGETVWEIELVDTLSILDIAASHGQLYLAGLTGEKDEYGNPLIDQKGVLLCFDQFGNKRWEQVDPHIASYFGIALPSAEGCFVFSSVDETGIAQTYIASVCLDGTIDRAGYLVSSVAASSYVRFFLTEGGDLMQVGKMITGEVGGVGYGSVYITTIE